MPQTGLTYYINSKTGHISSMIDGQDSIVQAIYKALDTEKLGYEIYGWLYGLDMTPFVGADFGYIQTHIQMYIEDCLLQDDRINAVTNLEVTRQTVDSCLITFDVDTTEGIIENISKEINYGK